MSKPDLAELWRAFLDHESVAARNALLNHYSPLVRAIAHGLAASTPSADEDDLVSSGVFGLLDALSRFDPARNIKFETFASSRIRGAMLDELRSNDWVPRSVRDKTTVVDNALNRLNVQLGRKPTDTEMAVELGMTTEELHGLYRHASFGEVGFSGFTTIEEASDNGTPLADLLTDYTDDAGAVFDVDHIRQLLIAGVNALRLRERVVLALYYYEGLTFSEIGTILGVGESRACQIHVGLITQLSNAMRLAS